MLYSIGIGMSRFVLYREVLFIRSVLYQRFHCILSILLEMQANSTKEITEGGYICVHES